MPAEGYSYTAKEDAYVAFQNFAVERDRFLKAVGEHLRDLADSDGRKSGDGFRDDLCQAIDEWALDRFPDAYAQAESVSEFDPLKVTMYRRDAA